MSSWFHSDDPDIGFMNVFSNAISETRATLKGTLPDLRAEQTILIGSDYGGFHKNATYEVLSFIITNAESLGPWDSARLRVRARFLKDGRRLSYKA